MTRFGRAMTALSSRTKPCGMRRIGSRAGTLAGMVFVADDLGAWLVALLADAGRKRLTNVVLGSDQERTLRRAATTAVKLTVAEFHPDGGERAEELAMVVSEVFSEPLLSVSMMGQKTLLEGLQAAIASQAAPLADPSLTSTRKSSADLLGISATVLAQKLTGHLVREIVVRGARGGPLAPLAAQLNHDATHLQGQRIENILGRLANEVRKALARLDTTHAVAAAPTALAQLPPVTAGFTGRDAELAVLVGLLDPAGAAEPVVVAAVGGLAGVGKTTLAVQAGHAAMKRGWFSGGVLFVDLHGYNEAPVEPGQALDALLRALGLPTEHIPPTVEERAWLYRSALAQITESVLVIADNASSEAQVRPLLPGAGRHKVLVTSRHTLAGLGARLVDVTILDQTASIALLDLAVRAARPDDNRITGDPAAAARLAGACGGLPLALQITAALLVADRALSAAELAGELAAEPRSLQLLRYDDGSEDGAPSVAAAFELSYRRLEGIAARLFRLLPVAPGPDVSTAAAAVLADLPVREVRGVLAGLAQAHLAETVPGAGGRWRMHDLMRLYAQQLSDAHADADGREQARDRLLDYYITMADAADDHLRALPGMTTPADFTGRDDALDWLDAERLNLVDAVSMAATTGRNQAAVRLPPMLAVYLDWRRRFDDWQAIFAVSVGAARRIGDRHSEAIALGNLGNALINLRRFEEAITALQDSAALCRKTDDRENEGSALDNLGSALHQVRLFNDAIAAHQAAAALFRETGNRQGEGTALANLSVDLKEADRFDEAITACQNAITIFQQTGDRQHEAMALTNLGLALQNAGRVQDAITACQTALLLLRETGDRNTEGGALVNLGNSLREVGRFGEAITACRDAAAIYCETGDRHGEAMALSNLGLALHSVGQFDNAITAWQEAASIFRATGDHHRESSVLGALEAVQLALPDERA
jgi:tetratricopeptide (TPR) repeat protein